jgi:hypothetical protein
MALAPYEGFERVTPLIDSLMRLGIARSMGDMRLDEIGIRKSRARAAVRGLGTHKGAPTPLGCRNSSSAAMWTRILPL